MPAPILLRQYLLIPLIGLLGGWATTRFLVRHHTALEQINDVKARRIVLALLTGFIATMGWMVTARYLTWHSFVFDLGSYDQKVWLVSQQSNLSGMWQQTYKDGTHVSPCGINWYWGICHFQPWLLIPGLIYKVWDSPLVLLWIQVLLVASGVIPTYLLARERLDSAAAGVLASAIYVLYPAVQYNGVVDFRPDHAAIPTMLWAYVLAARGRYPASLAMAFVGGLAKETLILNGAFFGLYLAIRHKQRIIGGLAFILGLAAFYSVMFYLLRFNGISEGRFMIQRYFPSLSILVGGMSSGMPALRTIIQNLTQAHKLLYLEALLVPLAFLPLFALPELIPAIPCLAISLLASNPDYSSIQEQYSASVVAPAFAAFLVAVADPRRTLTHGAARAPIVAGIAVLCLFVSFGLGPTPLSRNFWNSSWGGRWHVSQYRSDRGQILDRATALIPTYPNAAVVTQNDINSGRLAHRNNFFAFPYALNRADYVLLDTRRQPYVHSAWDPERYYAALNKLEVDQRYQRIFEEHGVLLFKRRTLTSAQVSRK